MGEHRERTLFFSFRVSKKTPRELVQKDVSSRTGGKVLRWALSSVFKEWYVG